MKYSPRWFRSFVVTAIGAYRCGMAYINMYTALFAWYTTRRTADDLCTLLEKKKKKLPWRKRGLTYIYLYMAVYMRKTRVMAKPHFNRSVEMHIRPDWKYHFCSIKRCHVPTDVTVDVLLFHNLRDVKAFISPNMDILLYARIKCATLPDLLFQMTYSSFSRTALTSTRTWPIAARKIFLTCLW